MSIKSSRFCVQFSGTLPHRQKKTEILYSESTEQTIRNIWKSHYDSPPPEEIDLINGDHSRYSLNDQSDFRAFMAIAEDHYHLSPAQPLHVKIVAASKFNKPISPPLSSPSPPPDNQKQNEEEQKPNRAENQSTPRNQPEPPSCCEKAKSTCNELSTSITDRSRKIESSDEQVPQDLSVKRHFVGHSESVAQNFASYKPQKESVLSLTSDAMVPLMTQSYMECRAPPTGNSTSNLYSPSELSIAAVLVNALQQQRLLQNSPNVSYLVQCMKNNIERASAMQLMNNSYSPAPRAPSHFSPSTMEELQLYRENRRSPFSDQASAEQKQKRKRKTPTLSQTKETAGSSGKRMRTSSELSNIEFHVLQAEIYHKLCEDDKQTHNSAHRSHWKHLHHVKTIFPEFIERNKTAKYDEWSSEARDIYAITLPTSYKWAFLTISKQGDNLCRRIKRRVFEMKKLPTNERPCWCPEDEVLDIAFQKADERLQQLEKLQETRRIKNALSEQPLQDERMRKISCESSQSAHQQLPLMSIPNMFGSGIRTSAADMMAFRSMTDIRSYRPDNSAKLEERNLLLQHHMKQVQHQKGSQFGGDNKPTFGSPNHKIPHQYLHFTDPTGNANLSQFTDAVTLSNAPTTSRVHRIDAQSNVGVAPDSKVDTSVMMAKLQQHPDKSFTHQEKSNALSLSPPHPKKLMKVIPPKLKGQMPFVKKPSTDEDYD